MFVCLAGLFSQLTQYHEALRIQEVSLSTAATSAELREILFEMSFVYAKLAEPPNADPKHGKATDLFKMTFGYSQTPTAIRPEPAFLLGHHFLHDDRPVCALACYKLVL